MKLMIFNSMYDDFFYIFSMLISWTDRPSVVFFNEYHLVWRIPIYDSSRGQNGQTEQRLRFDTVRCLPSYNPSTSEYSSTH